MGIDNYLSCDAMGGNDGCCGCLEWLVDGRIKCNECQTEFSIKPKRKSAILKIVLRVARNKIHNLVAKGLRFEKYCDSKKD